MKTRKRYAILLLPALVLAAAALILALNASDREKLADRDDMGDIGGMTDMYERINYAGKTPPDESAERLAAGAAAVVRRMIGDK